MCAYHFGSFTHWLPKLNYLRFHLVWFYLYSGYGVCGPAKIKSSYNKQCDRVKHIDFGSTVTMDELRDNVKQQQ